MSDAHPLVIAVRAKGSDARDVRDAAHEACHALQWLVRKKWTRDNIHAKKPKIRAHAVRDEITARAVEQLVCVELGVDPGGDVDRWALVCCLEMIKNERISLPSVEWTASAIRDAMITPGAKLLAARIVGLL